MTFQPPTIVISTPTIGFSTDHYSRFNRPLGVFTAHNWRFNRPVLAFQPPTIGVSTAHWAFQPPTIGVSTAHYWRFKRPLLAFFNRPLGVSTAHYWRFKRPPLAFQPPTGRFKRPLFLAPILVSTPPPLDLLQYRRENSAEYLIFIIQIEI